MSVLYTLLRLLLLLSVLGVIPARGDEITRQVQEELRKRNLYFGDVDGRRTEQVAAALRRYQQRKGFAVTGEADETTLRSLTLLPPAPRLTVVTATPAPGAGRTPIMATSVWPDATVLRSDEARRNPTPPDTQPLDIEPSPTPAIAPPPAAAAIRRPAVEAVRAFLEAYLQAGQSNDTAVQMPFYGEQVDYLNEGKVGQRFIRADIDGYDRRWPERRFTLLDPVTVLPSPDHDPDKIVATFHYRFAVRRPHDAPEGEMVNTYTLQRTGPESLRIIGMKETRVRGK